MLRPCALRGLGSAHLVAPTPQAKGKIERRFGTFHRRLVTLIAHARARTWQQSEDIIQMEIARQNRTVNRTLGKAPLEIWETQSLREEGRMRPAPSAALLDLHISLRCSRRVNHDHTIDFDDRNYDITPPTLRKIVTLVHHPRLRFWVLELPPKDVWPPILGHFTLCHLSGFAPARNPVLNRRRQLTVPALNPATVSAILLPQ